MRPVTARGRADSALQKPAQDGQQRRTQACRDLRCGCGSLLARRVAAGVELKCRRCKHTVLLPISDG